MLGAWLVSAAGWQGAPSFLCLSPGGPRGCRWPRGYAPASAGGRAGAHGWRPPLRPRFGTYKEVQSVRAAPEPGSQPPALLSARVPRPGPPEGPLQESALPPRQADPGPAQGTLACPVWHRAGWLAGPEDEASQRVASTPDAALAGDARHSPACASSVGIRTRRLQGDHPHPAPDEAQGLPGSWGRVRASERHSEPTRADHPAQRGRSRPLPPPQAAGKSEMGPGGSLAGLAGRI